MGLEQSYLPIADYGLIGDMRSAALVGRNGSIDWCCWPEFDSPAVFCRLLDAGRGGFFWIGPVEPYKTHRSYIPQTNVLCTTFSTEQGRTRVTDLMPIANENSGRGSERRIIRKIEGLAGEVELTVRFRPTPDYARMSEVELNLTEGGATMCQGGAYLLLQSPIKLDRSEPGEAVGRLRIAAGQTAFFVVIYDKAANRPKARLSTSQTAEQVTHTVEWWQKWSAVCMYEGPYHHHVRRSALVLKLLTHARTGALIAAPTTSLPENLNGSRNWDYRFTWLRDSALILFALQTIGYHDEAQHFWDWLTNVCKRRDHRVRSIYTIDGSSPLPERLLDHLDGYRGARPVRIGNAAAAQRQLDIYGAVLDAAHFCIEKMGRPRKEFLDILTRFAGEAARNWRKPDWGIWEVRTEPRHFLHSKLLCWVALDRAVKLGLDDNGAFKHTCGEIRETILCDGYNPQLGAFTQSLGSSTLDASALLLPLVGLLPATDERIRSTVRCIRERLVSNGLVYRYLAADGIPGGEATFALCSFWLVDNLALAGKVGEACALFERLLGYANDLGLLSEEIEPRSGDLLGNFPQGYTHLALIRSALHLDYAAAFGPETKAHTPAERANALAELWKGPSAHEEVGAR